MEDEFTVPAFISELWSSLGIAGKHRLIFRQCCRILEKLGLKDHVVGKDK